MAQKQKWVRIKEKDKYLDGQNQSKERNNIYETKDTYMNRETIILPSLNPRDEPKCTTSEFVCLLSA